MNPKPFSSLNHFTVPVAIFSLPGSVCGRNAGGAKATTTNAGTASPDKGPSGTISTSIAGGRCHERSSPSAESLSTRGPCPGFRLAQVAGEPPALNPYAVVGQQA